MENNAIMNISELISLYDRLHRCVVKNSNDAETLNKAIEVDSGHPDEAGAAGANANSADHVSHALNPFNLPDKHFELCFGFAKDIAWTLCQLLARSSNMSQLNSLKQLPFQLRLLATLSFLHHGHFAHVLALDAYCISSKFRLLQCVAHECEIIVLFMAPSLVKFPSDTAEIMQIKQCFQQQFGVPGVLGVLDCFFVNIQRISDVERVNFTNRLGQLALNVQVICDHNYRFLDVNARFPGSCSDVYIWKRSHVLHIMRHLQSEHPLTWLVGDRGYRLHSVLLNPYRNPSTLAQKTFNKDFKEVRCVLDKALVLLRSRFRCLNTQLPFTHRQCTNIITTCVTLHNYLLGNGYQIAENTMIDIPKKRDLPNALYEDESQTGTANREYVKEFLVSNHLKEQFSPLCNSTIY